MTSFVEVIAHQQDSIIFGGDFNCSLNFTVDMIGEEHHPQSSQTLHNITLHLHLTDSTNLTLHMAQECAISMCSQTRQD